MTYMGKPYYPEWLDNLADDVTLEAAAMDGSAHGPADVRSIVVAAKELYDNQQFSYAGPCGDNGFLEVYTTDIRGVHTRVRPRSALLAFSRVMLEKFSGTSLARHWQDTP
jgi:hypothetical protein